ncbi:unnamed protein product [Heterosigma akashiwo]
MALLKQATKSFPGAAQGKSPVIQLYRSLLRELPRVLTIYDIDMSPSLARSRVAYHFRKNDHIQDERIIDILVTKGYMHMEETLMQWKQKTHLMTLLDPFEPVHNHEGTLVGWWVPHYRTNRLQGQIPCWT